MSVSLHNLLNELAGELPGCLHTSVVDTRTGLSLAASSRTDPMNAAGADAFHTDLYRLGRQAAHDLSRADEVEEMVLTSEEAVFLSTPVETTGYLWLVVTEPDSTVGFTQAMMRKHLGRIEASLRELV